MTQQDESAVRMLPRCTPRAETGTVQFGDDWPGVFIRGDNAMAYGLALDAVLGGHASRLDILSVKDLKSLLGGCDARLLDTQNRRRSEPDAGHTTLADAILASASALDEAGLGGGQALREAAKSLAPSDHPDKTVEVRILVRVDDYDGRLHVAAAAYPGATEDDLRERVGMDAEDNWTDEPQFSWVVARVPKPRVPEVEGTVDT